MTRGSFAHKAAALDDAGMLREDTVDPRVLPYLTAWRDFKKTTGVEVLASEMLVFNADLGYAGTLDRIVKASGFNQGRALLLDLKSGAKCPWHRLQVAGYWLCMADTRMDAGCLYLKKTGKWSLDVMTTLQLAAAVGMWKRIVKQYTEAKLWDV
jgi:hypothetical protein